VTTVSVPLVPPAFSQVIYERSGSSRGIACSEDGAGPAGASKKKGASTWGTINSALRRKPAIELVRPGPVQYRRRRSHRAFAGQVKRP
jgi:hypothetical protein